MTETKTQWRIRIGGYGTFNFEGTEAEAEAMREHKARWEHGSGIMWRADLSTELDQITAQCAKLWDENKGVPLRLMKRRSKLVAERRKAA